MVFIILSATAPNRKRGKYVYQSSISRRVSNDYGHRDSNHLGGSFYEEIEGSVAMTLDGLLLNLAIIGIGVAISIIMLVFKKAMCDEIDWSKWD